MNNGYTSYTELSTFEMCPVKHYYAYHLRLKNRDYNEIRALTIGKIYASVTEAIYKDAPQRGEALDRDWLDAFVDLEAQRILHGYRDPEAAKWFVERDFFVDVYVARHLVRIFGEHVYPFEEYVNVGNERRIEWDLPVGAEGSTTLIGYVDHDYERDGLLLIGEDKTRGNNWSERLQETVPDKLQTQIYLAADVTNGRHPSGVVYTVVKKPKPEMLVAANFDSLQEQQKAIDGHYSRVRKPFYREEVLFEVNVEEVQTRVVDLIERRNAFADDLFMSLARTPPLSPLHFPCTFCDYFGPCKKGEDIDSRFTYKKKHANVRTP